MNDSIIMNKYDLGTTFRSKEGGSLWTIQDIKFVPHIGAYMYLLSSKGDYYQRTESWMEEMLEICGSCPLEELLYS